MNLLYSSKDAPRSLLSNAHRFSIIGQIIKKRVFFSQVVQVFSHIPPFLAWLCRAVQGLFAEFSLFIWQQVSPKMAANALIQLEKICKAHRFHNLTIHYHGMSSRAARMTLMAFIGFSYQSKMWGSGAPPLFAILGHIFPNICFSRGRREAGNCRMNVLYSSKDAPRSLLSNAHRFSIIGQIIKKSFFFFFEKVPQ